MQRGCAAVAEVVDDYDFFDRDGFDAPGYPKLHFIEKSYAHDPTNWWAPNRACTEAMLRSAGFVIEQRPEEEVYLCRRGVRETHGYGAVYPAPGLGGGR